MREPETDLDEANEVIRDLQDQVDDLRRQVMHERSEKTFARCTATTISLVVICICGSLTYGCKRSGDYDDARIRSAQELELRKIEAGYEQAYIEGSNAPVWRKVEGSPSERPR